VECARRRSGYAVIAVLSISHLPVIAARLKRVRPQRLLPIRIGVACLSGDDLRPTVLSCLASPQAEFLIGPRMSRTGKTKPFWVKLAHGDLKAIEVHNHTDGRCNLPHAHDAVAFTYGTTQCRREFVYTGTRISCDPICSHYNRQDRRRERHRGRRASRD
jgi:hypothetical protein